MAVIRSLQPGAEATPRVAILASGVLPGWRRAALLASEDDGQSWEAIGSTAAPAVLGTLTCLPESVPATLEDRRSILKVEFAHDEVALSGASAAALDLGTNLAMVGDELLQFGEATQVAPRRWRLRQLWRGRRGTEAAIGTQRLGDRFALIQADAIRWFEPRRVGAGVQLGLRAVGIDDGLEGASAEVPVTSWSLCPPSPVHVAADFLADGSIELRWVRRSRDRWWWRDGVEVPLGEGSEAYSVDVFGADASFARFTCAVPRIRIPAGAIAPEPVRIEVRQIGTHGASAPAIVPLPDRRFA